LGELYTVKLLINAHGIY